MEVHDKVKFLARLLALRRSPVRDKIVKYFVKQQKLTISLSPALMLGGFEESFVLVSAFRGLGMTGQDTTKCWHWSICCDGGSLKELKHRIYKKLALELMSYPRPKSLAFHLHLMRQTYQNLNGLTNFS